MKCGSEIMLTHINTMKNLHSHNFRFVQPISSFTNKSSRAPLSKNQEVSAFGNDGQGDDMDIWTVVCNYGTVKIGKIFRNLKKY